MAAFLSYTDAGSSFVYGQLVNGEYLNPQAIRDYAWNATMENITETEVEKLASIADGFVKGMSSLIYIFAYSYLVIFR